MTDARSCRNDATCSMGKKSAKKKKTRNQTRKKYKAKKRKRRKTAFTLSRFTEESTVPRTKDDPMKNIILTNNINENKIEDGNIKNSDQNGYERILRDSRSHMIDMVDDFLLQGSGTTWKQFLNLMEGIAHIPRVWLQKASSVEDILSVLRKGSFCKDKFQADSCLMRILRKLDSTFVKTVDPVYDSIVKLHKCNDSNTNEKKVTRRRFRIKKDIQNQSCPSQPGAEDAVTKIIEMSASSTQQCNTMVENSNNFRCKPICSAMVSKPSSGKKMSFKKDFLVSKKRRKRRKTVALQKARISRMQSKNIVTTNSKNNTKLLNRIASYGRWEIHNIRTGPLVNGGFSCKQQQSIYVECQDCGLAANASDLNCGNPLEIHSIASPTCTFIERENIQTETKSLDTAFSLKTDEIGHHGPEDDDIINTSSNPLFVTPRDRQQTYERWPITSGPDIDMFVDAGFYYTGYADFVRCFYCGIELAGWNDDANPWIEHISYRPRCQYVLDQKGHVESIQTKKSMIYSPRHPQHIPLLSRVKSFDNPVWQLNSVCQKPTILAAAGFFFTGKKDSVRCFTCDGGLEKWEPSDDPWTEHARWFPHCKFVLNSKGTNFIEVALSKGETTEQPVDSSSISTMHRTDIIYPSMTDPCRSKKTELCSAAAEAVIYMGYPTEMTRTAIDTFLSLAGRRHFTAEDLLELLLDMDENGHQLSETNRRLQYVMSNVHADIPVAGSTEKIDDVIAD